MTTQLLYVAASGFEAACHVPVLPEGHRARRLHGHSFQVRARVQAPAGIAAIAGEWAQSLADRLDAVVAPLDYGVLNEVIAEPSDENIARWIQAAVALPGVEAVGVQSTRHQGVDIDLQGQAHLWRRFRFEAAHQLPRVPEGHRCGRMHGHGFEAILHVNQDIGGRALGIDFDRIDELWQPLQQQLDYACLNDIAGLENPTSEMLARWIWQRLKPVIPDLSWVTVYETVTAGCHYDGQLFRIWKEQRFESAVQLDHASAADPRRRLHGHSYIARLHLSAPLDELMGWTIDYGDVRAAFTPVFRVLDHAWLNRSTGCAGDLRALLLWLRDACAEQLPALDRIDLFESPRAGATLYWGTDTPALPGHHL